MLHGDSEFSFLEIANLEEPSFENISKIAGTALRSFSVSKKEKRESIYKKFLPMIMIFFLNKVL